MAKFLVTNEMLPDDHELKQVIVSHEHPNFISIIARLEGSAAKATTEDLLALDLGCSMRFTRRSENIRLSFTKVTDHLEETL